MIAGHNSRDGEPPMFPPGTPLAVGTFKAEPFAPDHAEWRGFAENLGGVIDAFRAMAASWGPALRDFGRSCARANRAIAIHNHRRNQDERRCYAKQARRERTGGRQTV